MAPLADRAVDIATLVCVITREDERTNPNVVKMVENRMRARPLPRAALHSRGCADDEGRCTTTSASTPIDAAR